MSVRTFQLIVTMQLLIGTFERIQNVSHMILQKSTKKWEYKKKIKKSKVIFE